MQRNKAELIREAAVRVFAGEGFHRARMDAIAHEARVAVGTIYNYFKSKEEILLSIFQAEFDEQMPLFDELQASSLPIRDQIKQILDEHFCLLRKRKKLARVLLQERFNPGTEFTDKLIGFHRQAVKRIEELIQKGIEQGWVRCCNPCIVASALFAVVQSISICEMSYSSEKASQLIEDAPGELADFIWNGLRKREADEQQVVA